MVNVSAQTHVLAHSLAIMDKTVRHSIASTQSTTQPTFVPEAVPAHRRMCVLVEVGILETTVKRTVVMGYHRLILVLVRVMVHAPRLILVFVILLTIIGTFVQLYVLLVTTDQTVCYTVVMAHHPLTALYVLETARVLLPILAFVSLVTMDPNAIVITVTAPNLLYHPFVLEMEHVMHLIVVLVILVTMVLNARHIIVTVCYSTLRQCAPEWALVLPPMFVLV